MKLKGLMVLILTVLLALPGYSANNDLSHMTAGRVRFAIGNPELYFNGKAYKVGFDYLVLLGSTYDTKDGRLELVDFNNSTYWFDKNTKFHFETIDIGGDKTTLYFGKGKAVIETKKPVVLSLASSSVFLREGGTYLVMRDIEGKDNVYITKLSGKERPSIIKRNKIFTRVHFNTKTDNEFVSWVKQRKHDWALTKSRMLLNSMVDKLPPVLAYTDESGKTRWYRVSYVKPIHQISNVLHDNWYIFNPELTHAYGLLSPSTIYMTDYALWLWFSVNRWNSIKWAWDPFHGWHAEFYYDPLAGFGAEYGFSYDYVEWQLSLSDYLARAGYYCDYHCIYRNTRRGIVKPLPEVRERVFRYVKKPLAIRARLNTDPEIRDARVAAKVGLRESDYRRLDYYAEGGGRRGVPGHAISTGVGRNHSINIPGRPIYTITPVKVIHTDTGRKVRSNVK
ncbi:hypothetical protein TTHT_0276 [Thermotomaculum hydrothermale]|uniref:FecR protein domain-containing protein n=1 Tax=Thermotomaculum hydrothermale TaxID=981385 RepID=A0A7R6PKM9_9BACT|nr:hypothetical protein [Thermotomaculum hydrothermale]BBB31897.1 hypothetical protein TTHT_0276 [Thermotomaculum hydrothermale]